MKLSLLLFTQGDSGWRQPGFSRAGGSLAFVLAKVQAKESSALRQNWLLQCFSVWTDQWSVEFLFQWMATVGHVDRLPSWIDTLGSQICWWSWYMKLYEPLRYVEPPTSCFNPASQRLKCFGTKQTRQPWFKIWRHHLIFMHDGPTCCVETHLLNWNLWDKLLPVVFAICNDPHPVAWHLWFPGLAGWLRKIKRDVWCERSKDLLRISTELGPNPSWHISSQHWWTGKTSPKYTWFFFVCTFPFSRLWLLSYTLEIL